VFAFGVLTSRLFDRPHDGLSSNGCGVTQVWHASAVTGGKKLPPTFETAVKTGRIVLSRPGLARAFGLLSRGRRFEPCRTRLRTSGGARHGSDAPGSRTDWALSLIERALRRNDGP
jgi:hypothetical protein